MDLNNRDSRKGGDSDGADVVIRRALPADLPALGRLGALLVRTHHAFDPARFLAPGADVGEGYAWFLGTQLDVPEAVVLVAEQTGAASPAGVVGYVYAGIEPHSWKELREAAGFIHDVVIAEGVRGEGIGTRLLEAAATWLERNGAPRLMLWTAEQNGAARRLFARLGFRPTMVEMTRERSGG